MPRRGSFVGENLLYDLRVILESYSTSGTRILFIFLHFFSFQDRLSSQVQHNQRKKILKHLEGSQKIKTFARTIVDEIDNVL